MSTWYKYRVWCDTDNKIEYVLSESETPPTKCPINTAHVIDTSKTSIVEIKEDTIVIIDEEQSGKTSGGNYKTKGFAFDILATDIETYFIFSFPFITSLGNAKFKTTASMDGDIVNFVIGEDTVVGAITAAIAINDTVIEVSQAVVDNAYVGYILKVDGEDLGEIKEILGTSVTITNAATATHAINDVVTMTVHMVETLELDGDEPYTLGLGYIGGSYISKDTLLKCTFINKEVIAKTGDTTNASAVITSIGDTSDLAVGMKVGGIDIPVGTTIQTIDSGTQVTLTANATATSSGSSITFSAGSDKRFRFLTEYKY